MSFVADHLALVGAAIVVAGSLLLGFLARWLVRSWLDRLARATTSRVDDVLVESLPRWLPVWFVLGGALVASSLVEAPPDAEEILRKCVTCVAILSATFWLVDVAMRFLHRDDGIVGSAAAPTGGGRCVSRCGSWWSGSAHSWF